jgi:hypothetical protein
MTYRGYSFKGGPICGIEGGIGLTRGDGSPLLEREKKSGSGGKKIKISLLKVHGWTCKSRVGGMCQYIIGESQKEWTKSTTRFDRNGIVREGRHGGSLRAL